MSHTPPCWKAIAEQQHGTSTPWAQKGDTRTVVQGHEVQGRKYRTEVTRPVVQGHEVQERGYWLGVRVKLIVYPGIGMHRKIKMTTLGIGCPRGGNNYTHTQF